MNTNKNYTLIMNAVSYIALLIVNVLAQTGLLNGLTTSEISNKYLNLFTPSGYVFSIWALIYLLLGAYIVYQFITNDKSIVYKLAPFVFASNLLNILWLLSWHYSSPLVSLIVILILLVFLILIVRELRDKHILAKTTFTIYYAWISVASIASIFAFLITLDNAIYNSLWFIILTDVALAIVGLLMITKGRNESFGYILTLLWSTIGIFVNHLTTFKGSYMSIMVISMIVILVGVTESVILLIKKNR